jgi:biotin carboxyl carrier protein
MKYIVKAGESELEMEVDRRGVIRLDGEVIDADLQPSADPTLYSLIFGHRSYELRVEPEEGRYLVQIDGVGYEVVVEDERTHRLAGVKARDAGAGGDRVIKSPMPGIVIDVPVKEGDPVEAGRTLVVVESMKMHNEFKAPSAGTVHAIRVAVGEKIAQNAIMVTLRSPSG